MSSISIRHGFKCLPANFFVADALLSNLTRRGQAIKHAGKSINMVCAKHPLIFSVGVATTKTLLADFLVQRIYERRETLDKSRMAAFGLFGCLYMGAFQHFLYNRGFPRALRLLRLGGNKNLMAWTQVAFDQSHALTIYLLTFYSLQACIYDSSISQSTLHDGLATMRKNWTADATNISMLYVPLQFINFKYVPVHWRVSYVAGISMIWCCILSLLRGDKDGVEATPPSAHAISNESMMHDTRFIRVDTGWDWALDDMKVSGMRPSESKPVLGREREIEVEYEDSLFGWFSDSLPQTTFDDRRKSDTFVFGVDTGWDCALDHVKVTGMRTVDPSGAVSLFEKVMCTCGTCQKREHHEHVKNIPVSKRNGKQKFDSFAVLTDSGWEGAIDHIKVSGMRQVGEESVLDSMRCNCGTCLNRRSGVQTGWGIITDSH